MRTLVLICDNYIIICTLVLTCNNIMDTYGHLSRSSGHKPHVLTFCFLLLFCIYVWKTDFLTLDRYMSGQGGGRGGQMSGDEALARQLQDKFFLQELQVYFFIFFKDTGVPTNAKKKILLKRVFQKSLLSDRQLKVSCSLQVLFLFFIKF